MGEVEVLERLRVNAVGEQLEIGCGSSGSGVSSARRLPQAGSLGSAWNTARNALTW